MIDPISAVAGGMSIVQGVVQLYKFLAAQGDRVISAYFDDYGEPLHGDELIKINVHRENKEAIIWWFEVNPIKDYVFIRAPVIETSVIEIPGQNKEEKNPEFSASEIHHFTYYQSCYNGIRTSSL